MIRGGRIVQQVVFAADRERVFGYFTDADGLGTWMGEHPRLEARTGGEFRCGLPGGQEWRGVVLEVEEPTRLVLTMGWTDPSVGLAPAMSTIHWEFSLDARGTRLRMRQDQVPEHLLELLNDCWARLFARLRNRIAGRPAGPHPLQS